jgi:hypothetical protein
MGLQAGIAVLFHQSFFGCEVSHGVAHQPTQDITDDVFSMSGAYGDVQLIHQVEQSLVLAVEGHHLDTVRWLPLKGCAHPNFSGAPLHSHSQDSD